MWEVFYIQTFRSNEDHHQWETNRKEQNDKTINIIGKIHVREARNHKRVNRDVRIVKLMMIYMIVWLIIPPGSGA